MRSGNDVVRQSFLEWLAAEDSARQAGYVAYREYYDGDHSTQLTKRMRRYLQLKIGEEFRDNYCPIVVDALDERLCVTGFDVGDDEAQAQTLWYWWQANRMDGVQGHVHKAAIRDGDTYLLVEFDNDAGLPRFSYEPAYDGASGMKVHYSKERRGVIAYASKRWRVESEDPEEAGRQRRLNLYYPDRIEKYQSHDNVSGGDWVAMPDENGEWPIPWKDDAGQPLGVPVVHFANAASGYNFGQSELKNIIPLQNALNKSIIDLLAAADNTAFRVFWCVGDNPSGLEIAPGSWVYSERPATGEGSATLGYFPGEDLRPLIELKNAFVVEIARVSRTPLSMFQTTGQVAAEGTLKQQESPLVSKAKDRQVSFGNSWEDAFAIARRLYNAFGDGGIDEGQMISAQWRDPETRNDKEFNEGLMVKRDLGIPEEQLWRELGYDADKIAEMKAMQAEAAASTSNIGGELLRAFEGGM